MLNLLLQRQKKQAAENGGNDNDANEGEPDFLSLDDVIEGLS